MSIQTDLAKKIQSLYADSVVKKVDRDNFVDIYLPQVNPQKGTHLFFNTARGVINIGFYCRDLAFVEKALRISNSIEQYSQGVRLKGNPTYADVDEAVNAAVKLISTLQGNPTTKKSTPKKVESAEKKRKAADNKPTPIAKTAHKKKKPSEASFPTTDTKSTNNPKSVKPAQQSIQKQSSNTKTSSWIRKLFNLLGFPLGSKKASQ